MNKKVILIFLLMAAVVVYFVIKNCLMNDEMRVKKLLTSFERAAEAENLLKCMSYISRDYSDDSGFDYSDGMVLGKQIFDTYDDIFIHVKGLKIEVKDDEAQAEFVATAFATRTDTQQKENLLERRRGSDRFVVDLRKEDNRWKILSSRVPRYIFE